MNRLPTIVALTLVWPALALVLDSVGTRRQTIDNFGANGPQASLLNHFTTAADAPVIVFVPTLARYRRMLLAATAQVIRRGLPAPVARPAQAVGPSRPHRPRGQSAAFAPGTLTPRREPA